MNLTKATNLIKKYKKSFSIIIIFIFLLSIALVFYYLKNNSNFLTKPPIYGEDYKGISPPLSYYRQENIGKKIEIIYGFWSACPSCYNLEANYDFSNWLNKFKSKYVDIIYLPAPLGPRWGIHARIFWTAKQLGFKDGLYKDLFQKIHAKRRSLDTTRQIQKYFAEKGISASQFGLAFNSKKVKENMDKSLAVFQHAKVASVPVLIINGKQQVSENYQPEKMLKTAKYLIIKELSNFKKFSN